MSAAHVCSRPVAGIMKAVNSALHEVPAPDLADKLDELVYLYYIIADHDLALQPALDAFWSGAASHGEIASRILARIAEFPFGIIGDHGVSVGREAMDGVTVLVVASGVGDVTRRQGKLAFTTLFNRTILDTEKLTSVLRLLKESWDGLSDEGRKGLLKLIRSLNTGSDVKGVWYQLRYVRDVLGFDNIFGLEVRRPGSHRGIDIIDIHGNFYELKGGPGVLSKPEFEQILKQLGEEPIYTLADPDGWRRYRHVSNGREPNHAQRDSGRFLGYLWRMSKDELDVSPGVEMPDGLSVLLDEFEDYMTSRHPGIDFDAFMSRNTVASDLLGADLTTWGPTDAADLDPLRDAQDYLADRMFFRHEIPEIHDVGTAGVPVPP